MGEEGERVSILFGMLDSVLGVVVFVHRTLYCSVCVVLCSAVMSRLTLFLNNRQRCLWLTSMKKKTKRTGY